MIMNVDPSIEFEISGENPEGVQFTSDRYRVKVYLSRFYISEGEKNVKVYLTESVRPTIEEAKSSALVKALDLLSEIKTQIERSFLDSSVQYFRNRE